MTSAASDPSEPRSKTCAGPPQGRRPADAEDSPGLVQPARETDGEPDIRLSAPVPAEHLVGNWTSEGIYFRGALAGTKLTERRLKRREGAEPVRVIRKVVVEVGVCQVSLRGANADAVADVWIRYQFEQSRQGAGEGERSGGSGKV